MRSNRRKRPKRDESRRLLNDPASVIQLCCERLDVQAGPSIVVMLNCDVEAMPDRDRNHGRGDDLGMWVHPRTTCALSVTSENNELDTRPRAEEIADGVWRVPVYGATVYMLLSQTGWVLVDAAWRLGGLRA